MSLTTEIETEGVYVFGCARCGLDHDSERIVMERLVQPIDDPDGPYTHWAPCPENGQPILMRVQAEPTDSIVLDG